MQPDPHCSVCLEARAFDGITYKPDPEDPGIWLVMYEGRETDTAVVPNLIGGDVGWWAMEYRGGDGVTSLVDVYGYAHLIDFERAYAARACRERNGDGSGPHLSDNREAPPMT